MTLKVVSESRVTWAISVPILVFLGLSVLKLRPMYATDRRLTDRSQTDVRQKHRLMPPPIRGGGIINVYTVVNTFTLSSLVTRDSQGLAVSVKEHAGHYVTPLGDTRLRLWDYSYRWHCRWAEQGEAFPTGSTGNSRFQLVYIHKSL